jgi:hypothetical protein
LAENSNKNEQAQFWLETGVKVGLAIWAFNKLGDLFSWDSTGRGTARVKFNFHNTQVLKYPIGGDPPVWKEIADPWNPIPLADELHNTMKGNAVNDGNAAPGYGWDPYPRHLAWKKLMQLGNDRMKWLHNYWLDRIDDEETLYRWIKEEKPLMGSDEAALKDQLLQRMAEIGIGF